METIKTLERAPTLVEFCNQVDQEEKTSSRHQIAAYDLKLYPNETLAVESKNLQGRFMVSEHALPDLARVADIPTGYFETCDSKLRSLSFNWRLRRNTERPLQLVLTNGNIDRILNSNLLPAPRYPILDTVSKSMPENVQREDLKVVKYAWNGRFDISVIAPTLSCEPRRDDIVAFGVNVSEGRDGAVRIQGAAFRCWCSNGAINRICDSRFHRLRRPINRPERHQVFLQKISVFAREAWGQWAEHAEALRRLTEVPVDIQQATALKSRLRQAPFFLSLRIINQVISRLEIELAQHEGPTLYDLYNAMTFVGTHNRNVSFTYRARLRLGAGEFTRNRSRVCTACRQLLLT